MTTILMICLSMACLLVILGIEYYFVRLRKPVYLSNQAHIILYITPLLISFLLFSFAISDGKISIMGTIFMVAFIGVFLYMLSYDKVIIRGSSIDSVIEELNSYLKASGRQFTIHPTTGRNVTVEINNYSNALIVREAENWVEIDNHLHYDEDFIIKLNDHFRQNAKNLPLKTTKANVFFYLLILIILSLTIFFSYYSTFQAGLPT